MHVESCRMHMKCCRISVKSNRPTVTGKMSTHTNLQHIFVKYSTHFTIFYGKLFPDVVISILFDGKDTHLPRIDGYPVLNSQILRPSISGSPPTVKNLHRLGECKHAMLTTHSFLYYYSSFIKNGHFLLSLLLFSYY